MSQRDENQSRRPQSRRAVLLAATAFTAALALPRTARAEPFAGRRVLLMVDDRSCVYCARWKREVETGYRNSDEGRFAPLEIRERGHPDLARLERIVYTPTFLLLDDGREVGRLVGYAGSDFFWAEIDVLYRRAGFGAAPAPESTGARRI